MSMKVMEISNALSNISATISIDNFLKTAYQNVSIEKSETFFSYFHVFTIIQQANNCRCIVSMVSKYRAMLWHQLGEKCPFSEFFNPHFSINHKYHNKNNVKLSYGCIANTKSLINVHNTEVITEWRLRGK